MKFKGSVDIAKPRAEVVDFFIDPQYLGNYQDGFVSKEVLSGEPARNGTISRMMYKYGKRDMELTETILENKLPESFLAEYHHKHMDNYMLCRFIEVDERHTRYEYEFEYTRMEWVLPRLMAILFPGMYRKQGEKWMRQFKEFVEQQ